MCLEVVFLFLFSVSNLSLVIFIYNLSKDIRNSIRFKDTKEVEILKIEQKPKAAANRRPRTQEEKDIASKKKKEWWEKKRQEEGKVPPDVKEVRKV